MKGHGAGILDFLRPMTPLAVRFGRLIAKQGFHSSFGMATSTNHVIPETGVRTTRLEMMAEGAIRAESRARVDPRVRVYMLSVGKIEHDRLLVGIAWKGQQVLAAGRRKHRVALHAELLLNVLFKVVLVARRALVVSGALKHHGARLHWHMTSVTIEPNLLQMVFMQVKWRLRLRLCLRLGLSRRRRLIFRGGFLTSGRQSATHRHRPARHRLARDVRRQSIQYLHTRPKRNVWLF